MKAKGCGKPSNSPFGNVRVGVGSVGRGLLATRPIRAGEAILTVLGKPVSSDAVWDAGRKFASNCFRLSTWTYLDPLDGPGRFLNHSCSPNAALVKRRRRLTVVALCDIAYDEEVSIDYSTNLGFDDIWMMRCRCGSRTCRKVVRNFGSLPASIRGAYMRRGLIPHFILQTQRFARRDDG